MTWHEKKFFAFKNKISFFKLFLVIKINFSGKQNIQYFLLLSSSFIFFIFFIQSFSSINYFIILFFCIPFLKHRFREFHPHLFHHNTQHTTTHNTTHTTQHNTSSISSLFSLFSFLLSFENSISLILFVFSSSSDCVSFFNNFTKKIT